MDGVALPNKTGMLYFFPLNKAISIAWYLGVFSCLYVLECSSSTMIIPRFVKGANIALLAPIAMETSFLSIFRHSSYFSPSLNLLCNIATSLPKRFLKMETNWGVNDISGTKTIASFFSFKTVSIACIYTSVFPDPVTP